MSVLDNLRDLPTGTRGKTTEFIAVAKLLERGCAVALPVVDDGVDLVVNHRIPVQVRSAQLLVDASRGPRYRFILTRQRGNGSGVWDDRIDFFLLHGRDTDEWWVCPAKEILGKVRLSVRPGSLPEFSDAWHLLVAA